MAPNHDPMIISKTGSKSWINRHDTFNQRIMDMYDLANDGNGNLADYNSATSAIQDIIRAAMEGNYRLRALGGGWSFTRIAATDGVILNTKLLNHTFKLNQNNVGANRNPENFFFAQCGVSVKELNDSLRMFSRSLKTSGASNGQTIVGAIATGTHGAALSAGSIQDAVVALHIILGPEKHIWLERQSRPVVSSSFVSALNTRLIRDDDLFNAALVSFGSFGIIHGVMIETEPLFLYEAYKRHIPLGNDLYHLMETLDFANTPLAFPGGKEVPYHFQVLINPYDPNNVAYITIMYKRPYLADYTPPTMKPGLGPGDDAPTFIGAITSVMAGVVPGLVNGIIKRSFAESSDKGTHGEIFSNTDLHGKVLSCAMGVPLSHVNNMRKVLESVNQQHGPFAGVFSFRFVKSTEATLGFTRFPGHTCVIEADSVPSKRTTDFYEATWTELDRLNIPYTFHWGKLLNLDAAKVRKMYGDAAVDGWISARQTLMQNGAVIRVFNNDLLTQWGLDDMGPVIA